MRSTDRVLVLEPIDVKKKDFGMIDPAVVEGTNTIRAVMDRGTTMWYLRYDRGAIPAPLRIRWTDFNTLLNQASLYFRTKNLSIKEVKS